MTALEVICNPPLRRRISDAARTSDATVKAWLRGVPAVSVALNDAIATASAKAGVDLTTRPVLAPDAIAHARARRRGDATPRISRLVESVQAERAEVARLRARVAELEAELAAAQARTYPVGAVAAIRAEDARAGGDGRRVRIVMPDGSRYVPAE
jgi:hypothetical protein